MKFFRHMLSMVSDDQTTQAGNRLKHTVALSGPISEKTVVSMPTKQESPCELQPPPLEKVKKTSDAEPRSPRTQSGMRIAKKPAMCKHRMTPSTRGSLAARNVLNRMLNVKTA